MSGFAGLSRVAVIGFLLILLPLLSSSVLTFWTVTRQVEIAGWSLVQWGVVTMLLAVSSSLALTPPTFLAIVYGFFLGWVGVPFLIVLNTAAIGLVFLLARAFRVESVRKHLTGIYPRAARLLVSFDNDQLLVIFFAKLSPVLPFAATNLLFVVAGAKFRQIVLGGTMGMIPRTILAVWLGREAQDIAYLLDHPNEGLASKVILMTLIIASTVGIGLLFRQKADDTNRN